MAEGTIASVRRHRGVVWGRLTSIEKDIPKVASKTMLGPSDQWKIKCLLEQVKENDKEFKQRHLEVLNFIDEKDKDTLDTKEKV